MTSLKFGFLSLAAVSLAISVAGCGKPQAQTDAEAAAAKAKAAAAAGFGPDTDIGKILAAKSIKAPQACDVLTEAIAKKYLGADAQQRQNRQQNPHMSLCQYGGKGGVITVDVGPWDMVNMSSGAKDKPVTGIGDEAHAGGAGLYVRKGKLGMTVDVMVHGGEFWGKAADDENAKTEAAEEKVAPDLVPNLH